MSDHLWHQLPAGFLKKTARGWLRLDRDIRELVVELARAQKFKCAFCDAAKNLIIEHDHWPDRGSGDKLTVYNVRGLACPRCNWHLGMYEADQRGDYRGFDDASIHISEYDFEPYSYAYDCRVQELIEKEIERELGPRIYWRRVLALQKFDDWQERSRWQYPPRSYFAEIKRRRRSIIRTPEQFLETAAACIRFLAEQKRKNPDYEIPETFLRVLTQIKSFLDEIWPQIEGRYREIQADKQAASLQSGAPLLLA